MNPEPPEQETKLLTIRQQRPLFQFIKRYENYFMMLITIYTFIHFHIGEILVKVTDYKTPRSTAEIPSAGRSPDLTLNLLAPTTVGARINP